MSPTIWKSLLLAIAIVPLACLSANAQFGLEADYNADGVVDALDAAVWAANLGSVGVPGGLGDGNADGVIDGADYQVLVNSIGLTVGGLPVDPTPASLIYNPINGNAILDQSLAAGGIITAFFLNSPAGDLLAPGVASFPFQTPVIGVATELDTANQIGQIDVNVGGLPTTQFALGQVLPAGLSLAELETTLDGSFYLAAPGNDSSPFALVVVPEPSAMALLGIAVAVLGASRKKRSYRDFSGR